MQAGENQAGMARKETEVQKPSGFSPNCVVRLGEGRASVALALSGTSLLGLVCISSQCGRNPVATGAEDK